MQRQSGQSLVQLLVLVAVVGVLAAIAVPALWPAQQAALQDDAVTTMRLALDDAVSLATAGQSRPFNPSSVVGLPTGVLVNAAPHPAPDGSILSPEFELLGGRGTPLVREGKFATAGRPARVAVILSDAGATWATALVLNTTGIVTRYDWRDNQWNEK